MRDRRWHKFANLLFTPLLLLWAATADAVSIDKIEVGSHLGEPFYAEAPLKLESNELPSKVFVEIAGPADYKIFEVYRDPALKQIRADVASDARGVRVKLTSRSRMNTPFLNLVLKIRYGRVSRFKKFPVFLDAPKSVAQIAEQQPQPAVQAVKSPVVKKPTAKLTENAGQAIAAPVRQDKQAQAATPQYFEGWARTDRYGPIVRGDSLSTIAERLRVDYRYTRNQIMMALFHKNPESFDRGNINLIKAGSSLKVPTAAEVEANSKSEALAFLGEQEAAWKQLTQQPRYAAEAEAQRTRYAKRISVGEQANGTALAPESDAAVAAAASQTVKQQPENRSASSAAQAAQAAPDQGAVAETTAIAQNEALAVAVAKAQEETNQILEKLQEQNQSLQQQLLENQQRLESMQQKARDDSIAEAAAKARIEKLELLLTRLQSRLEQAPAQQPAAAATGMNWVIWLLIALVAVLLVIVVILMRREPAHPAASAAPDTAPEPEQATQTGEVKALESVIEDEVSHIETGERKAPEIGKTAEIDALASFTDELSETSTTELEAFDIDAEPDPDIDYLSEAEVYIRYGMDDEAIKQLDMALKLQPDNVEAHIKKAELLLGKHDNHRLDETIAAATMTLTAVDLDRFKSSIEKLGLDLEDEDQMPEASLAQAQETLPLDEAATEDLDFALSDLDVPDIEQDQQQKVEEEQQQHAAAAEEAMDWLHDEAFDGTLKVDAATDLLGDDLEAATGSDTSAAAAESGEATQMMDDLLTEFTPDQDEASIQGGESEATQMMGDLLSEFSPEPSPESTEAAAESATAERESGSTTDELDSFEVMGGATQELDSLLSEFAEIDEPSASDSAEGAGATQHLDQLLSEFDDDDEDLPFTTATSSGIDAGMIEQGQAEAAADRSADVGLDTDHGATQELDHLLAEFAESDEPEAAVEDAGGELDASLFEPQPIDDEAIGLEIDHGATQELDNLLSEFAEDGDEVELDSDHLDEQQIEAAKADRGDAVADKSGEGATQVLGRLLDEFNEDEDDDSKSGKDS